MEIHAAGFGPEYFRDRPHSRAFEIIIPDFRFQISDKSPMTEFGIRNLESEIRSLDEKLQYSNHPNNFRMAFLSLRVSCWYGSAASSVDGGIG